MTVHTTTAGFKAGRLEGTYKGNSIGQVAAGYTLEWTPRKRLITGDLYGAQTPQDAIFQGWDVFVEFTALEWNAAGMADVIWPYDTAIGDIDTIGLLDVASSQVGILLLQDVAGTPATNQPDTLTANRAVIAEDFDVRTLLIPDLREVPIRMRLYPDGNSRFFDQA